MFLAIGLFVIYLVIIVGGVIATAVARSKDKRHLAESIDRLTNVFGICIPIATVLVFAVITFYGMMVTM